MKAHKIVLPLITLFLIVSCGSDTEKSNIKLNDGEKWEVNEEMKPHIVKAKDLLDEYQSENKTDYRKLAEDLQAQNNKLVQSCTMKGESHDELHKWLHPHMELVKKLSKAENAEKAKKIIDEIDKSFNTYQKYFE